MNHDDPDTPPYARRDFLREIVARDVREGKHDGKVRTRFPPEPNGYLHIGHAKAICADFGVAEEFDGVCHLRMDDTNPLTEEEKYVEAAARDVRWLGFEWEGPIRYASDYFGRYWELALQLVRDGKAYVDSLPEEEIRERRGTVTEPGRPSPYRDRPVEESLELCRGMREGEFDEGEHVLRARIDMAAENMKLRDPVIYRVVDGHHYRTGDEWPIYPMYDWAHPLGDAIEGITHSFCTLEFEENRALYDWVVENTRPDGPDSEPGSWDPRPRQYEFSRLNLDYTIMSKSKLGRLVRAGDVEGWDDPRMPTLAGLRRRGIPPRAVRRFCDEVGLSRAEQRVQISKLEHVVRDELNRSAPRVMCVLRPLKLVIENYPEYETETVETPTFPRDVDREGTREVPFARELYVERDDFRLDPPEGYYRLAPGREVRLRHAYFVTCEEVVRDDETGEVVELRCTYDPETRGGSAPDGRSPDGTIHWVPARASVPCEVRLYDRLFDVPDPEAGVEDFRENLNPESLEVLRGSRIEPGVLDDDVGARYQFFRQGYFVRAPGTDGPGQGASGGSAAARGDRRTGGRTQSAAGAPGDAGPGAGLAFNRIVHLRDPWAEREAAASDGGTAEGDGAGRGEGAAGDGAGPAGSQADSDREGTEPEDLPPEQRPGADHERRIPEERRRAREEHPELAGRFRAYQEELGLSEEDADLLTGDPAVAEFFESALDSGPGAGTVANWLIHELRGRLEDRSLEDLPFGGTALGELAGLVEEGTISQTAGRQVLEAMIETGDPPAEIVEREGLERIADREALDDLARELVSDHPDEAERYREGQEGLLGFFVGRVMRRTEGRADPELAKEALRDVLEEGGEG
jgi:glutaminyl-tRNA synthetase